LRLQTLGLELIAASEGDDPSLAKLWRLPAGSIRRQALVSTPGLSTGRIHLVQFERAGLAVRAGEWA